MKTDLVTVESEPKTQYNIQGSHERTNVRPLRTRTEKDALNLRLEGPMGLIKKVSGYVCVCVCVYFYFLSPDPLLGN